MALTQVSSEGIKDAQVKTADILDANITTAKVADANITTAKLADANITTAKVADANITTAKVADNAITGAKIADNLDIPDNNKIRFGTGNDAEIYHSSSDNRTYIRETGSGAMCLQGDYIKLQKVDGSEDMAVFKNDGAVELYHNGTKKLETGHGGEYGSFTAVNGNYGWDGMTVGSGKFVFMGSNSDEAAGIWNDADNEWMIKCNKGAATELQFDGSKKLETTSTGSKIEGNLVLENTDQSKILSHTADGSDDNWLSVNGGGDASQSRGGGITCFGNEATNHQGKLSLTAGNSGSSNGTIDFTTGGTTHAYITHDGHFLFSNDSSKLKFGTSNDLQIFHDGYNRICGDDLYINNKANSEVMIYAAANGAVQLYYDGTKKFETTSTGALATGKFCIGAADRNIDWHHPLQVEGTSAETSSMSICRNSNDINPPYLTFCKTRGTAVGGTTAVQENDLLGNIQFKAADGDSGESTAAQITCEVDAAVGNSDTAGRLFFKTSADGSGSPTSRLEINKDGYVYVKTGDLVVESGNLKIGTAGKGIDFSVNSSAGGMTSELLDGYEEGTWTPTYGGTTNFGSTSHGTQIGHYTRVGSLITLQWNISWTATSSSSGGACIGGIPYTGKSNTYGCGAIFWNNINIDAGRPHIIAHNSGNSSVIYLYASGDDNGWDAMPLDSAGNITGTITYTI